MAASIHRKFVPAVVVCAVTLALATVVLLSRDGQPAQAAKASAAATKVVGEVVSVSGSKKLKVTPAGGRKRTLRDGDDLRLGDVVDPGAGVKATLKLAVSKTAVTAGTVDRTTGAPVTGNLPSVSCVTCHDVHNGSGHEDGLLRASNEGSALCLTCHDK